MALKIMWRGRVDIPDIVSVSHRRIFQNPTPKKPLLGLMRQLGNPSSQTRETASGHMRHKTRVKSELVESRANQILNSNVKLTPC
jgi:hypothetical protein